ncbi:hypothetical protein ITX31_06085 [Arthrobacter gandavensis]|uniref:LysM peptidoglycan-binding domain-containing protein n=1 Tax=Arthrobacter gandavensis TaxID=169960 RepID=UPI00188E710D|nr:LysM domain-containing protein [Arthrobacter gandavensis]MBF4993676.1 hypothetical protein [Arthrobacter gandavensis]
MTTHKAQRRRTFEDMFQAAAVAAAGTMLLCAGLALGGPAGFGDSYRSLTDLQSAAGLAAAGAGLLVLGWWTVGLGAAFLSAALLRGGSFRAAGFLGRLSPGFLKRLAAAALGVQLAASPLPVLAAPPVPASSAAPSAGNPVTAWSLDAVSSPPAANPAWQLAGAGAQPSAGPNRSVPAGPGDSHRSDSAVDPLWKPSPGPVEGSLLIPGGTRGTEQREDAVTVTAGDTLWGLAAARLGPLATDHEIAEYWPAWHETNLRVIGPDPHRLLPGQVLAVPPPPAR